MFKSIITKFNRRPFPRNLQALKACRISYSQFGEDLFISHLLGYEMTEGVFVDIGCYHPIKFSNTYIFYQRGWSGVAIDPNQDWEKDWKRYRPRDKFVRCAISDSGFDLIYIKNRRYPACNRLVSDVDTTLSADEVRMDIETRRINDVLAGSLSTTKIDLMNIDCEGQDLSILKDLDFGTWRPKVVAAEDKEISNDTDLVKFMSQLDYSLKGQIGITKVFQCLHDL